LFSDSTCPVQGSFASDPILSQKLALVFNFWEKMRFNSLFFPRFAPADKRQGNKS
jgi:hypothetical protein